MLGKQLQTAAAGSAGGGKVYVDDVFSCFLYEGNNTDGRAINNGINLSGEGGLVWIKARTASYNHILQDTERGATSGRKSNSTAAAQTISTRVTGFTSTGFTLGLNNNVNGSSQEYGSWTFRKTPGFFDVVTFTSSGASSQQIAHNLGSVPGCIIVKNLDSSSFGWYIYHRGVDSSSPENYGLEFTDAVRNNNSGFWNNTAPTSTHFTLGNVYQSNTDNYVAYVFAHDDQSFGTDEDEAIIKCDSYTGNGTSGNEIYVGFEPQWLMIKRVTGGTQDWRIFDSMRGIASGGNDSILFPNQTTDEQTSSDLVDLTATGFKLKSTNTTVNGNGNTYVYVAIRRPHKPPSTATDVFAINTESNDNDYSTTGFPVDAAISNNRDGSSHTSLFGAKLMGENVLRTGLNNTQLAALTYNTAYTFMDKFRYAFWGSNTNGFVNYAFKRAPGFFDVVTYKGGGGGGTFSHNLGAVPKLMIIKCRDSSQDWTVYAEPLGNQKSLILNSNGTGYSNVTSWNSTTPTDTTFQVNGFGVNSSGNEYVAYLFGNLDGVSKVGTFTGANSAVDVNCGFTNGARFVMIKRISAGGHWYIWDTTRGIASGNDPYLILSDSSPNTTTQDHIDPLSSGFKVNYTNFSAINGSGHEYLFLAIA